MTVANFKNARGVRSAWLEEGGRRLDCNPYMSGALEARDALERKVVVSLASVSSARVCRQRECVVSAARQRRALSESTNQIKVAKRARSDDLFRDRAGERARAR